MADDAEDETPDTEVAEKKKAPFSLPKRSIAQTTLYIGILVTITAVGIGVYEDEEVIGPRNCRLLFELYGGTENAPQNWNPAWPKWVTVLGGRSREPADFEPFYERLKYVQGRVSKSIIDTLKTKPQEASTSMVVFEPQVQYGPLAEFKKDRQIR